MRYDSSLYGSRVDVTQQDIDAGFRERSVECPISIAVGRLIPGSEFTVEDSFDCLVVRSSSNYDDVLFSCDLPEVAKDWREAYHSGQDCGPFSFAIPGVD